VSSSRASRRLRASAGAAALALLAQLTAAACTPAQPPQPRTLRVLASSELAGMRPILAQAAAVTGVRAILTPEPTLTAVKQVLDGTARRHYDAVWFGSDDYLDLYAAGARDAPPLITGSTPIMASPVMVAVRAQKARQLGWDHGHVTWRDIAGEAGRGRFTFGMSNPKTAIAGLEALISVATAISGDTTVLRDQDIPGTEHELGKLFSEQAFMDPSSLKLTQTYLRDLRGQGRSLPDGVIDYEADLRLLQAQAPRDDPLTLVYPTDGVVTATYPMSILGAGTRQVRDAFSRLTSYLLRSSVQREIGARTYWRPIGSPRPGPRFYFPSDRRTVTDLTDAYFGQLRAPGRIIYLLDVSESMGKPQISQLQQAVGSLSGADASIDSQVSKFRAGEEVTFMPFNYGPLDERRFTIPARDPGSALPGILRYLAGLSGHGRTAIYKTLEDAYQQLAREDATDPGRIDTIVLLSDGGNDLEPSFPQFLAYLRSHPEDTAPVYTIALGAADAAELARLASVTNGTAYDARHLPPGGLTTILRDIRGYQ
jgi:Ca-activated chloride channel family protein